MSEDEYWRTRALACDDAQKRVLDENRSLRALVVELCDAIDYSDHASRYVHFVDRQVDLCELLERARKAVGR